jgi:uncharacterized phiE125 gp8 family phage protein
MSSVYNLDPIGNVLFEAVTTDELKKHMRVSHTQDDLYISALGIAARQQVEKDFNVAIVGQNYDYHLENGFYHFYHFWDRPYSYADLYATFNWVYHYPKIHLPVLPVSKDYPVTITYTDPNGSPQTFDSANYVLKLHKDPPEIMLKYAPLPQIQPGSDIIVNFTAGFVTTSAVSTVPQLYKQAIQLLASSWYENHEGTSDNPIKTVPLSYERIKNILAVKRFA